MPIYQRFQNLLTGHTGFEPVHDGTKNRCLTAWLYPNGGGREWIRTTEPEGADLQSAAIAAMRSSRYVFDTAFGRLSR